MKWHTVSQNFFEYILPIVSNILEVREAIVAIEVPGTHKLMSTEYQYFFSI